MATTFKLKRKTFSKKSPGDRELCPPEVLKKVKEGDGVVQKIDGKWRIVSLKTSPASLWPQIYSSKERAEASLSGYHASKGK